MNVEKNIARRKTQLEKIGKIDKKNVKTTNSAWTTVIVCHLFALSGLPERLQVITYWFTLLSLKRGISHETK